MQSKIIELQEAQALFEKNATTHAVAKSNFEDLDSLTKTVLAGCYQRTCHTETAKSREMDAYAESIYEKHLRNVSAARREYLIARANLEIAEKSWEVSRSILSVEKTLARIL